MGKIRSTKSRLLLLLVITTAPSGSGGTARGWPLTHPPQRVLLSALALEHLDSLLPPDPSGVEAKWLTTSKGPGQHGLLSKYVVPGLTCGSPG